MRVTGVSADGLTIVGDAINPAGDFEGFVIVVPEPSGAALFVACACITLARSRRSRR